MTHTAFNPKSRKLGWEEGVRWVRPIGCSTRGEVILMPFSTLFLAASRLLKSLSPISKLVELCNSHSSFHSRKISSLNKK